MWTIAKHDLLMWRRMPLAIACALIPPIGMTLILVSLSLAVIKQPVALVVEGHGLHSQHMQQIIESDTDSYVNYDFSKKLQATDAKTAQRLLENQQIAAIIKIPSDFDQNVQKSVGKVHLILNNVDIDFADDIRRSVDRSVAHFDAPILSPHDAEEAHKEFELDKSNPYRILIDEHDLRETNVEWLHYQVIPALVLLVLSVGLMGTALLCAQDIERKTARYLLLYPQHTWILVGGRLLGGVVASLIALVPAVSLCVYFGIITPPLNHWPALVAIFVGTAICASSLGAIVGALLSGSRTIAMASSVVATYMFFLGGGFTTIVFLPAWLQTVSSFIPMRYAIDGMRQALFYSTLNGVTKDISVLYLTAMLCTILGSITVRRSWAN